MKLELLRLCVSRRDNYGFVTFLEPDDAKQCMERECMTIPEYLMTCKLAP